MPLLIDDRNFTDFIKPQGYGLFERDWDKVVYGSLPFAGPVAVPTTPINLWEERIKIVDAAGATLDVKADEAGIPCLEQDGVGYCHAFSPTYAAMLLDVVANDPFKLLSASSVGGPVTGYVNKGAWIYDDLKQIVEHGIAEEKYYPMLTTENKWTPEGVKSAGENKITEWWEGQRRNYLELGSCLLSMIPPCVGLNWWAHAVTYLKLLIVRKTSQSIVFGVLFQNSWGDDWGDKGRGVLELVEWFPATNQVRLGKGVPDEAYYPRVKSAAMAA